MLAGICRVTVAALLTAALGAAIPPDKACDVSKVEDGWWCEKDSKVLDAKDVDTDKKLHKGTDHAVTTLKVCVKSYHQCQDCSMKWGADAATPG